MTSREKLIRKKFKQAELKSIHDAFVETKKIVEKYANDKEQLAKIKTNVVYWSERILLDIQEIEDAEN